MAVIWAPTAGGGGELTPTAMEARQIFLARNQFPPLPKRPVPPPVLACDAMVDMDEVLAPGRGAGADGFSPTPLSPGLWVVVGGSQIPVMAEWEPPKLKGGGGVSQHRFSLAPFFQLIGWVPWGKRDGQGEVGHPQQDGVVDDPST